MQRLRNSSPAVSVIIPNYNHASYLRQRIDSVLSQTFTDFELIILDDASTDNSREIIEDYLKQDSRISFYPSRSNSGDTFIQWTKGVSLAKSGDIWIAESDDAADANLLMTLKKKLDEDPEVSMAYCQSARMDAAGIVNGSWKTYTDELDSTIFRNDFTMQGKEYIRRFLIHRNTIPNASAVIFRKSAFEKAGGAPTHLKTNGDWLTWLKMLCFGKIAFVANHLNYFRYHDSSVIARAGKNINKDVYSQQYDCTMREHFLRFVKQYGIQLDAEIRKVNASYIAKDKGNEGLFLLGKGQLIKGWKLIFEASFYPTLQSGFIKRAIKR